MKSWVNMFWSLYREELPSLCMTAIIFHTGKDSFNYFENFAIRGLHF